MTWCKRSGGCVTRIGVLIHLCVQRFDRLIGIVGYLHYLFVLLEQFFCYVDVIMVEVDDYLPCDYIHIPYELVIHGSGVHIINGAKEDLFKRLFCCLVLSPHSFVLGVNLRGGRNLDGGAGAHCVQT